MNPPESGMSSIRNQDAEVGDGRHLSDVKVVGGSVDGARSNISRPQNAGSEDK